MICYEKDGVQMIVNENMARVMESCGYKRAVEKAAPSSVQISELEQAIETNPSDTGISEPKTEPKQYQRLSPFAYRDELEKALNEAHFGNRLMMFGV